MTQPGPGIGSGIIASPPNIISPPTTPTAAR